MITLEFTHEEFVLVKKGLAKLTKSRKDSLKNSIKYDRQNIVSKRETEIGSIMCKYSNPLFFKITDNEHGYGVLPIAGAKLSNDSESTCGRIAYKIARQRAGYHRLVLGVVL